MEVDKEIGYIRATMERLDEKIDGLTAKLDKNEASMDALGEDVQQLQQELSIYKTVVKTFGAAASTVILVLTFEWGAIKHLWER